MGQIGQTLGGIFGVGVNPGLDTYGASPYGQDYANLIQQQQANLNATNQAQTGLVSQLGQIAQGQGPNPAQAMLNQSTGQNVAKQASLAAGQRGASQNVGMIQRNAAQQGRTAQQQAAGQGATMQAQQQLGAMGQQAGVLGQQGQQAVQGMGAYEAAINSANQINAQTAANQAQFGQGFGGGLLTGLGSMIAEGGYVGDAPKVKMAEGGDAFNFGNAGGNYTNPAGGTPASQPSFVAQFLSGASGGTNGKTQKSNANTGLLKSMLGGLSKTGSAAPMSGAESLGSGSGYNANLTAFGNAMADNPGMAAGNAGWAGADTTAAGGAADLGAADAAAGGDSALALLAAYGGKASKKVDALVSPGEHRIPKDKVAMVAGGKVNPLKVGETFPGKPKVKGNSYSNDTISKKLPEGDVIIPNSIMQSKNPERGAAEFVRDVLNKKRKKA